jgi:hypothetical protein
MKPIIDTSAIALTLVSDYRAASGGILTGCEPG